MPESRNSNEDLGHFGYLFLQFIKEKAERQVIMVLLRFIYLTLHNCAGKLLKALSEEEKQEKMQKGRKMSRKAHSLASNSPPVRNGE